MTIITIIPVITIRSVVDGMAVIVAMIVPDLKILDWGGDIYVMQHFLVVITLVVVMSRLAVIAIITVMPIIVLIAALAVMVIKWI